MTNISISSKECAADTGLQSLLAQTDNYHEIPPRLWAYAALVGEARQKSNEGRSRANRDRGHKQNHLGHLQGAFCELFVYYLLRRSGDGADGIEHLREHLFNPEGGSREAGADLVFLDGSGLDVKSFDCAYYKRYFAINAEKHEKLRGKVDAYFCVMVPPLGRRAYVTKPVPYLDVEEWDKNSLGSYGDPSCNETISKFLERYASAKVDLGALASNTYSEGSNKELLATSHIRLQLAHHFPSLEGFV